MKSKLIYLDNAATSFPKPMQVQKALFTCAKLPLGNPGRSVHSAALNSAEIVYSARETLAGLFGAKSENVVFTHNASHALNMAILGSALTLPSGKNTVITSRWEHNSVLRPLYALQQSGRIKLRFFSPGNNPLRSLENALDQSVGMAVITARSNVTGQSLPTAKLGAVLKRAGILHICDASQAAGTRSIDIEKENIDILCMPGHKGLMGITGSGAMIISQASPLPLPVFSGGSGNDSLNHSMPELLPERFEVGTTPVHALAALQAGAGFVASLTPDAIGAHENKLASLFVDRLKGVHGVRIYSPSDHGGIVLLNIDGISPHSLASSLDEAGICARSGFHCAPLIHEELATGVDGALRLSFGVFNTESDALFAAEAIAGLAR